MLISRTDIVRRVAATMAMAVAAVGVTPSVATALSCAGHPDASPRAIAEGSEDLSVDGTFGDHYDGAIFGTVTAMDTQDDGERPNYGHTQLVVDVTGTYGPDVGTQAVVVEDDPGWHNGHAFEVGTHYFIPYVETGAGLYSHVCDPITEIDPADVPELVEVAEEQSAPADEDEPSAGAAPLWLTAALVGLVAAVAVAVWGTRQ